jgi:hypothetical protein
MSTETAPDPHASALEIDPVAPPTVEELEGPAPDEIRDDDPYVVAVDAMTEASADPGLEAAPPEAAPVATGTIPLGGGTGLAIAMAQAENAQKTAQAVEGVLSFGFDLERAWREVEHLSARADETLKAWEAAKSTAADRKREHDEAIKALHSRINALSEERRKPRLEFTEAEELDRRLDTRAKASGCTYEATTGRPCPECRRRRDEALEAPAADDAAHPAHPAHARLAAEVEAAALAARLVEAGFALSVAELVALDLSAVAVLRQWLDERHVIAAAQAGEAEVAYLPAPEVFTRKAHRAAEADFEGGRGQSCARCGRQLRDDVALGEIGAYAAGMLVGLDCEGEPLEEAPRPTPKRGTRNRRRKHDPDAEKAAQRAGNGPTADADESLDGEVTR